MVLMKNICEGCLLGLWAQHMSTTPNGELQTRKNLGFKNENVTLHVLWWNAVYLSVCVCVGVHVCCGCVCVLWGVVSQEQQPRRHQEKIDVICWARHRLSHPVYSHLRHCPLVTPGLCLCVSVCVSLCLCVCVCVCVCVSVCVISVFCDVLGVVVYWLGHLTDFSAIKYFNCWQSITVDILLKYNDLYNH